MTRTSWLYFGTRLLSSPLEALFTLLIFILNKELNASLLQITILSATKPLVSNFAFYINTIVTSNKNRIPLYLLCLNIAGCVPCLLFPFMDSPWYFITSYIIFMTALRASYPAWMETLKSAVGLDKIAGVVAKGVSINYALVMAIPLLASTLMDEYTGVWRWIFVFLAVLQLLNTILLYSLKIEFPPTEKAPTPSIKDMFVGPLKEGWALCKQNKAFAEYLLMFLLGGAGLVMLMPILPAFFNEVLHLSYVKLTLAISLTKGIAFLIASPFWGKWKKNLFGLNVYVNLLSCLFVLCLLASTINSGWIYVAYIAYGFMQAACELSFNVCGPVFSNKSDSLPYSGVNLSLLGIRGCIFPFLGQTLFIYSNVSTVFLFSGLLCFISMVYAYLLNRKYPEENLRVGYVL